MSGRFLSGETVACPLDGLSSARSRLCAPRAFVDATSMVEDALVQLRSVEHALERQLGDLRAYLSAPASLSAN